MMCRHKTSILFNDFPYLEEIFTVCEILLSQSLTEGERNLISPAEYCTADILKVVVVIKTWVIDICAIIILIECPVLPQTASLKIVPSFVDFVSILR